MWQSPEATMVLDSNYRLLSLLGSTQYMITGFSILAFSLPFTKSNQQKGPSLLAISTDTQWNIIMITFISLLQFPHVLKNKPTKQASNQELTECCLRVLCEAPDWSMGIPSVASPYPTSPTVPLSSSTEPIAL